MGLRKVTDGLSALVSSVVIKPLLGSTIILSLMLFGLSVYLFLTVRQLSTVKKSQLLWDSFGQLHISVPMFITFGIVLFLVGLILLIHAVFLTWSIYWQITTAMARDTYKTIFAEWADLNYSMSSYNSHENNANRRPISLQHGANLEFQKQESNQPAQEVPPGPTMEKVKRHHPKKHKRKCRERRSKRLIAGQMPYSCPSCPGKKTPSHIGQCRLHPASCTADTHCCQCCWFFDCDCACPHCRTNAVRPTEKRMVHVPATVPLAHRASPAATMLYTCASCPSGDGKPTRVSHYQQQEVSIATCNLESHCCECCVLLGCDCICPKCFHY